MGLTIVHKSDLAARKRNPRIALVLAGGAVSGGAYKLGGLKALDDFLVNRKTTDFDIYVGLSAGSVLAAPLAGGITPAEMLRSLEGSSEDFTPLTARDFYGLNLAEFATKPVEFVADLLTYFPGLVYDFLAQTPKVVRDLEEPLSRIRDRPSLENLLACVKPMIDAIGSAREFPFPLAYLPSGIFSNRNLERYLRHNMERRGLANDFRTLYRNRARRALHRRHEPRHRRTGGVRARRGLLGHDLRSRAGVDCAARLLQAGADPRHRLRRRGRAAYGQHRRRHRARRRPGDLLQPLPAVHQPRDSALRRRSPALRHGGPPPGQPGHADGAEPGLPHPPAFAPPARRPPVPGRSRASRATSC